MSYTEKDVRDFITKAGTVVHSQPDQCIEIAQSALKISEDLDFQPGIGMSLLNIGLGHYYKGIYTLAIEYYSQALETFERVEFLPGQSMVYNNFGAIYCRLNNYEKGLEFYLKAYKIDTKIDYKQNMALTLNNIGSIYSSQKNFDDALEYYFKSIDIAEEIGFQNAICNSLTNIGNVYLKQKDFMRALEYLNKSRQLCYETSNNGVLVKTLTSLSDVYYLKKMHDQALDFLEEGIEKAEEMNNQRQLLIYLTSKAQILMDKGLIDEAGEILESMKDIDSNIFINESEIVYKKLMILYELRRDYKSALEYSNKHAEQKIKRIESKHSDNIAELRTRFEVTVKENDLQTARKKNEELEQKVHEGIEKWKKQHQLLIQKSKLESIGKLAAGMAHEINQPLLGISLGLENIRNKIKLGRVSDEYLSEKVAAFSDNVNRIRLIIEHVRIFSREQSSIEVEVFDVNETVGNAVSVMSTQFRKHNIELLLHLYSRPLCCLGNRYRFEQVIINLLSNARDAVEDLPSSRRKIDVATTQQSEIIVVSVKDTGIGVSGNELERIFDPFYTTKEPDKGTGLGLSIAYGIIKDMNGSINISSEPGEFTEAVITLPMIESEE